MARRNDRLVGVGLAIGAAGVAAIGSRYLSRKAQQVGDTVVDWRKAEQIAIARLAAAPGALTQQQLRTAEHAYARAMRGVVPLLEQRLGFALPGVVERHAVVDRAGWARANIATFQQLIGHLEPHIRSVTAGHGFAADVARLINRFATTQQVGFLLGYLGTRVLGQYDIALLSAEAQPGKLLFVDENIRATAATLDVSLDDFRVWIALHETTHAYEFEANTWLRPYLRDRLERQLVGVLDQAKSMQSEGLGTLLRRLRESSDNPLVGLLGPEQRRLFEETQRVMSLLEGFSDWVMDEVGSEVLPNVTVIREKFDARRYQRRGTLDRVIARLTGLDLKLEQYRRGEEFVAGVAAAGGRDAVKLIWAGPESLPTEAEFLDPRAWLSRVAPHRLAATA
ncbi:MAG TPA: zinc-dependent metalloprotease [Candidatus Limnocylindrales bacterium]|nr:zinc-dependent metalloprotease [Candidatus Limnocylindrales bacterium]